MSRSPNLLDGFSGGMRLGSALRSSMFFRFFRAWHGRGRPGCGRVSSGPGIRSEVMRGQCRLRVRPHRACCVPKSGRRLQRRLLMPGRPWDFPGSSPSRRPRNVGHQCCSMAFRRARRNPSSHSHSPPCPERRAPALPGDAHRRRQGSCCEGPRLVAPQQKVALRTIACATICQPCSPPPEAKALGSGRMAPTQACYRRVCRGGV